MPTLSDLYDADRRTTDPVVAHLADTVRVPHPLHGVTYADGEYMPQPGDGHRCTPSCRLTRKRGA